MNRVTMRFVYTNITHKRKTKVHDNSHCQSCLTDMILLKTNTVKKKSDVHNQSCLPFTVWHYIYYSITKNCRRTSQQS